MKEVVPEFYTAACGLPNCHWRSEPVTSDEQARQALRAHVNGHPHHDLVDAACDGAKVARYAEYAMDPRD